MKPDVDEGHLPPPPQIVDAHLHSLTPRFHGHNVRDFFTLGSFQYNQYSSDNKNKSWTYNVLHLLLVGTLTHEVEIKGK